MSLILHPFSFQLPKCGVVSSPAPLFLGSMSFLKNPFNAILEEEQEEAKIHMHVVSPPFLLISNNHLIFAFYPDSYYDICLKQLSCEGSGGEKMTYSVVAISKKSDP